MMALPPGKVHPQRLKAAIVLRSAGRTVQRIPAATLPPGANRVKVMA